ncbi:hypothetical protein SAMN02745126_00441 [Enhydrobacter aerosaccus]|uniref:Uncharacterized protein n=1 Tax=Enhydrobacter aerosaccus TaxID=225324 RepID=A0A1T4JT67_9HYPH|nr:hypothetical protein [Enhydrobacter aerosaccus]SJZ33400.1 hypothetical protein SAMN02745126_00441 [Enhydrobacter aerosaccus]
MTIIALPRTALESLGREVQAASWFAALGEPLTDSERGDAEAYADAHGQGRLEIAQASDWPEAENLLKVPDAQSGWWEREEAQRKALLAKAEARYPDRALWTALTELTTQAGDLVHGKAASAAARMGKAAPASIHVAAGAASHAVYQLAVARLADEDAPLFESKFRLFAAGRWPLGIVGSRLFVF